MRYKDFELTEDELFELNMSPSNLEKMAANIDARAGMEFEMIIPGAASGDDEYDDPEPDYDMDESFPSGRGWHRDVTDFFMGGEFGNSRREVEGAINRFEEDYYDWKSGQFDDWLGDNMDVLFNTIRALMTQEEDESDEDFEDRVNDVISNGGDEYDTAMEEVRDDFAQQDMFDEFLSEEGINNYTDFASQYNLTWPYITYPEPSGGSVSVEDVAGEFEQAIGRRVNYSSNYHGGRREPDKYVVEPDGSLEPDDPNDGGLEFVSPPLPLPEMLSDLDKVVKWASSIGAYTNDSTGLHMNVSVPDFDLDQLDYVKLAIFLGDEYVLREFGRQGNTYCKSAMKQIASDAKKNPDKVKTMLQQMQGNLSAMASKIVHTGNTQKYTSINTKTGYVEFRSPGGDWIGEYAANEGKIKNTLLRFVVALDIATKPELFRQEYMKKLFKTLDQGDKSDTIQFFAKFAAGELPQSALKSFVKQAQMQRKFAKQKPGEDEQWWWNVKFEGQRMEVVATGADQAKEIAFRESGFPSYRRGSFMLDVQAEPLRPYEGEQPAQQQNQQPTNDQEQRRQRAAQMPPIDFEGNYEVYRVTSGRTVYRFRVNNTQEAYDMLQRWRNSMMEPSLDPREFNVRAVQPGQQETTPTPATPAQPQEFIVNYTINDGPNVITDSVRVRAANSNAAMQKVRTELERRGLNAESIEAEPAAVAARGSESLPPGNARWRLLDRNGDEIYSFVNTTAQSDANAVAARWLRDNADNITAHGPFDVVPVPR